jgi:hypothetical protein
VELAVSRKGHELPFHRAVFRFCGFVTVRVGGSGLLAGDKFVEGFLDQLGRDGIVGFPGPFSQNYRVVVVRPFFRPLAGCLPGFGLGADAGIFR